MDPPVGRSHGQIVRDARAGCPGSQPRLNRPAQAQTRLDIQDSTLHGNPSEGFQTAGYPGIFFHSNGSPAVTGSTIS